MTRYCEKWAPIKSPTTTSAPGLPSIAVAPNHGEPYHSTPRLVVCRVRLVAVRTRTVTVPPVVVFLLTIPTWSARWSPSTSIVATRLHPATPVQTFTADVSDADVCRLWRCWITDCVPVPGARPSADDGSAAAAQANAAPT